MLYLPDEYHDYKYLADYSDNYVVLSKSSHIDGFLPSGDLDTINCIVQYYSPSITTIETTYSSYDSSYFTDVSSEFTSSIFARGDFPILFVCNFIIVLIVIFVINNLSKLFYKGGIFGNN